ncbi:MAG: DNA-directed RNA polymerase subunit beta' [Candidatus Andersenbacteria bacterium RIFCSPHIGHO2_02_FULL_45_11]|uniref:DNA-directed RNA polymerase subunit beta' n=1 Tax=Candidatus Andersenbacteria bacterium RIFCSPHIGHO2_12_FULL_45_11 TaxID=1797281 RepID=A0A1G1X4W4_9BACT|nr:MAG: DNA-directed RNA polymerase subunit beta' [Candidatus Andersenbacteria bacterium RIFCSPHIGHO2_01_FULL_46_36]OGY32087.1 MAG: DNA-directed RNA polymerase subunit beta' [Candidatus Andersenbacteria bacterium RIFCSPHIGHO2_02_FULL_45_11]OGY35048.1 MAG: DNA-directed RNA polymerase subunit beta' [Candidatus Andersenbacteria bacterium RIFCSPHIGHO2_12_FULL_45_11]
MDYQEKKSDFTSIRLKLASPENVLNWSYGEITKPETINYRTQKPEKDGLFDERIFGPTKDWECYCGKYRRIRYKGIVCDKCGVEVTRSIVRRERMAHISLATPVSHIWFLRGVPSKMGLLLNINVGKLEKVIYFASYIITSVDGEKKKELVERLKREGESKRAAISGGYKQLRSALPKDDANRDKKKEALSKEEEQEVDKLDAAIDAAVDQITSLVSHGIISEVEYRDLSLKYGHIFTAGIGAESIRSIFEKMDLQKEIADMEEELKEASAAKQKRLMRRMALIRGMVDANIRPEWMFLTQLPVIPPDVRPMVQLDGGRFAASDLNDLYRRVINRNNRLKRLLELGAPEIITRNEKRMLQEAVDSLIDNSARRGSTTINTTGQRRQLKSLADMLKGKQGRFRQNLLGKRVDYSGRSVIVVGPELQLHQCGLPKLMALELFKPFVIHELIERELAHNIRSASRLIEQGIPEVWDSLENVTRTHKVLLNRAPTLHRLGIQAFQPVLIEGKAIQIHPMVTTPFNADFDGDQMAVHVPLSSQARHEADEIMLSSHNLLKPADGQPATSATQDIVLGIYYITNIDGEAKGTDHAYASVNEAIMAYQLGIVAINAKIKTRNPIKKDELIDTTIGRLLFFEICPDRAFFHNEALDKSRLKKIISSTLANFGQERTAQFLDDMKLLGFTNATKSGLSWGMMDLTSPTEKDAIMHRGEEKVAQIRSQFEDGLLTDEERYRMVVNVWEQVREEMAIAAKNSFDPRGSVFMMVNSGARGSWGQTLQMVGMKGTVAGPTGRAVELPIKSSFKDGFNALEYFLSTHGTRKGMADTALRTATAGYLTRRLVNVAQDVVVHAEDCGDTEGGVMTKVDSEEVGTTLGKRSLGRILAEGLKDTKGKLLYKRGTLIDSEKAQEIDKLEIPEVIIRSVVSCKTSRGVCQVCYGWDLGKNRMVAIGEAVGVIAAQAIGEPGTQLTMRTFHSGGASGDDITQGLPRVEELFEARIPKGESVMADIDGKITVKKQNDEILITLEGKKETMDYHAPLNATVSVKTGDDVLAGAQLTEGHMNVQSLYAAAGIRAVQRYILKEVQQVYAIQGETINDKHLETIVRQMLSRIRIENPGDTSLLPGRVVEWSQLMEANEQAEKEGKKIASGERLLLGITKVSLSTESFLAAASFMETARVLIDAAVAGREDHLTGLKENVIIGRLIPGGTGYRKPFNQHTPVVAEPIVSELSAIETPTIAEEAA